jgi:hypothetical protein
LPVNEETVLAILRTEIRYSEETKAWAGGLHPLEAQSDRAAPASFVADESGFLGEFRGSYQQEVVAIAEPIFRDYLAELGLDAPELVRVRVTDSFPGSWIIEAALAVAVGMGTAYKILKEASELPQMAEGLSQLRRKVIGPRIAAGIEAEASGHLTQTAERAGLPRPPARPVEVSVTLDARPLQSLRAGEVMTRRVHISVSVADDAVSVENLDEKPLENLQLGVFCGDQPRHSWSLEDAFRASVPSLGGRQTLARAAGDFRNDEGETPDLMGAAFIDCWVQDPGGIHLFQFVRDRSGAQRPVSPRR